jgi:3-hydroxyisobutyrate dehydrogenase-like beta-hydroxyacid dehydrogenase
MLKDIRLALDLAKANSIPMTVAASVEQRFVEAKAAGYGDKATASVILPLESLTGVKVRKE